MAGKDIIPTTAAQMVIASGVDKMLSQIRPEWRAKSLIQRVKSLLPVDPSSACQRLLNAAIHDLREKIIIAGLDVAQEAATLAKLPNVSKPEDVYDYSTTHTLDLAYQMGLINRPEWRKLKRAYEIRKDLEHEDDLYEAGVEDCVYIFRTCIEILLSRDPISPVRVSDVKAIIESPASVILSKEVIDDCSSAPEKRQLDIMKFLIGITRDSKKPDIVRQNAIEALRALRFNVRKSVRAQVGQFMQDLLKTKAAELVDMKIASAAGATPYLKQSKVREFFVGFHGELKKIGHRWGSYDDHEKILDDFEDVGGLDVVPPEVRSDLVTWMVRCYIGEPGGYGMGINRPVFYSDTAAPRIERLFGQAGSGIEKDVTAAASDRLVKAAITNKYIARRYEKLKDIVTADVDKKS